MPPNKWITGMVEEAEVGKIYDGDVVNLVDFGAFWTSWAVGTVSSTSPRSGNERVEKGRATS